MTGTAVSSCLRKELKYSRAVNFDTGTDYNVDKGCSMSFAMLAADNDVHSPREALCSLMLPSA